MPTPRQIAKSLAQGATLARPLVLPIVFSLGAKIENLSLQAFLDNPTKISNALRQIRTYLRTDGVSCYFDPFLELEALGGTSEWDSTNQTRTVRWRDGARKGELPSSLHSPEEAASSSRVKIAAEVVRRLNAFLRDEPILAAGVTGPFTLAARLTQLDREKNLRSEDLPDSALDCAASAITRISAALVEAGANLIFIREEILPPLSHDKSEAWASSLSPAFNIIRFYEALPVVQLAREAASSENIGATSQQQRDAILCAPAASFAPGPASTSAIGVSVPLEALQADDASLQPEISNLKPSLLTTDGDVPVTTDLKRLMKTFDSIVRPI